MQNQPYAAIIIWNNGQLEHLGRFYSRKRSNVVEKIWNDLSRDHLDVKVNRLIVERV